MVSKREWFSRIGVYRREVIIVSISCVVIFGAFVAARRRHISVRGNLIALSDLLYRNDKATASSLPINVKLIAHAGGAVQGRTYTNSLEALDTHYDQGYRLFELDFDWTSDGKLVLVHDWEQTSRQFCTPPHVFSFREFTGTRRCDGLSQMTLEDLARWLHKHRDALVVTDTKEDNRRLLSYIQVCGLNISSQLIIQIYKMSELSAARQIDPRAVWFTAYKTSYPAWALRTLKGVDAIVIPVNQYEQYYNPDLMRRMRCYVHSIAADRVTEELREMPGIYGAYVD